MSLITQPATIVSGSVEMTGVGGGPVDIMTSLPIMVKSEAMDGVFESRPFGTAARVLAAIATAPAAGDAIVETGAMESSDYEAELSVDAEEAIGSHKSVALWEYDNHGAPVRKWCELLATGGQKRMHWSRIAVGDDAELKVISTTTATAGALYAVTLVLRKIS